MANFFVIQVLSRLRSAATRPNSSNLAHINPSANTISEH